MENLYNYVLHYNHFTKLWNAIPRDKYTEYWSDRKTEGILSSKKLETLIELITRGENFINSIN